MQRTSLECPVTKLREAREQGYKDNSGEDDDVLTSQIGEWEETEENGLTIQVFREINEITFTQSSYRDNMAIIGDSFRGPSNELSGSESGIELDPELLKEQLNNTYDHAELLVRYAIDYVQAVKNASISLKDPPNRIESVNIATIAGMNAVIKAIARLSGFIWSIKYKRCDGKISAPAETPGTIKLLGLNEKSLADREKKYAELMGALFGMQARLSEIFSGIASCMP